MINEDTTRETVQALWRRIEGWLSQHAPRAWQMLRPGVPEGEIQQAEAAMDLTLPADFNASCRMHDGGYVIDLVTEMTMFSLEEIVTEWQMFQELEEEGTWIDATPPYSFTEPIVRAGWHTGPIRPTWWHQCWIPIGCDRAGNHCCLDVIPEPGGSVGQVIDRDHEAGPSRLLASSFLDVLSTFASDLEAGAYRDTHTGLERVSEE